MRKPRTSIKTWIIVAASAAVVIAFQNCSAPMRAAQAKHMTGDHSPFEYNPAPETK